MPELHQNFLITTTPAALFVPVPLYELRERTAASAAEDFF